MGMVSEVDTILGNQMGSRNSKKHRATMTQPAALIRLLSPNSESALGFGLLFDLMASCINNGD